MIIQCQSCSRKFIVKDNDIPNQGRTVQCGYCSVTWHQMPIKVQTQALKKEKAQKIDVKVEDAPSVESIKASDGKTYRFLGSQWAELLPSGKTGLFARKKISQELDRVTGRKIKKTIKKRKKKLEEVDPSSESLNTDKKLPDIYKPKESLGFFGYIFLLIIIGFSIVGVLKTFEKDLINYIPEIEYLFILLDEQLEFFAETVKNIIVIIQDLIRSY